MKRILLLLAVLAVSAILSAPLMAQANPMLGTWKLNIGKSTFSGPAPKGVTRTVVPAGKSVRYTFKAVDADGNTLEYSFATDYDGKYDAVTGTGGMPGGADSIATKRVGPNKTQSILKKGTIQIATAQSEVSKDGKVCTVTIKGTVDGKDFTSTSVYDKQ